MLRKMVPALAAGALLALTACGGTSDSKADGSDGVKMGPGVTNDEIRVGFLSDFSGPIAEAATSGTVGSEVYFDTVNADGGVCGRDVVAVRADTKYDPQQTTQAYRSTAGDILMIGQILGTGSINAVKANIARDNMPTLAVSLNTTTLKEKDIYVPLPVFEVELMNGLVWAAQEAGASADKTVKVGTVTLADEYGDVYVDAMKFAAEATPGVELVASTSYTLADKDFTAQVSELKESGAEIVMLGSSPGETAGFVGTAAQLGYKPTWVAESGAWYGGLAAPLKGLLDKFYVSGGYGTLADDSPGINALKDALAEHAPDAKPGSFEVAGWLMGQSTVAALEKACADKDLTREGVTAAMKDLSVDYQGVAAEVNLGDGDSIVSYASRINSIGADGVLTPVGDFVATEAAEAWGEENGF